MADVQVDLEVAEKGLLPSVCAMTGTRADGAIPVRLDRSMLRWNSPTVRIPLSKAAFRRWSIAQSVMVKVRIAAMALVLLALVLSARSPFAAVGFLVLGGLAMVVSVRAEQKVKEFQPELSRSGNSLHLHGVHENFARAVEQRS